MATQNAMLQQILVSSTPALFALITGWVVFYGEFRALSERLEAIGNRSQQYHEVVRSGILEHSGKAAHGTVREDLARLDLRAKSLEHRVETLEVHASLGERYTEEDAKRDLDVVMGLLNEIKSDIRELGARVRGLEQAINVTQPKHSSNEQRFAKQ